MTDALYGFTLGFVFVLALIAAWRLRGWVREVERRFDGLAVTIGELASAQRGYLTTNEWDGWKRGGPLANVVRDLDVLNVRLAKMEERESAAGASDAALANLAARLSTAEKQLAAQDLAILDTAERVAHRLRDRQRKREEAEVSEVDDAANDPNLLLARARAAYPLIPGAPVQDPAQLQLLAADDRGAA